jgi:hypothetical protein
MDPTIVLPTEGESQRSLDLEVHIVKARRTAFVARFIVLRESKRTRAHRVIELMDWDEMASAEELAERFRIAFIENGDNMVPVERDLRRALAHSQRSIRFFVSEYAVRATASFIEALVDYERSNSLLFGAEDQPKPGGWRLPRELMKVKEQMAKAPTTPKRTRRAKTPSAVSVAATH